MKKTILLICFVSLFVSLPAWATPEESVWRRMTLLGINSQHYFAYVVERKNPGSYYDYTDRVLIEKYHIKTNRLVETLLVRETAYHLPDPEKGLWTHQDKKPPQIQLGKYLAQQNVHTLFPVNKRQDMSIVYVNGGLYLQRVKRKILLRKLGGSRLAENDDTELAGIFIGNRYAFLVAQQGNHSIDEDYVQKILPISLSIYRSAIRKLYKKK